MRNKYQSLFKKIIGLESIFIIGLILLVSCNYNLGKDSTDYSEDYQIYLYGELHAVEEEILEQYDLWKDFYDNYGMRNLFLEVPNYHAYFLNVWMHEEDDLILDMIFENTADTFESSIYMREFYEKVKKDCPETVFYGTDVGHQYFSTGEEYLEYLRKQKPFDMDRYNRVKKVMRQGEHWYKNISNPDKYGQLMDYREGKMVENFIYEFEKLDDKRIMGVYGGYHVEVQRQISGTKDPVMAEQLKEYYGDVIFTRLLYDEKSFEKYKDMKVEDVKRSR